MKCSTALLSAAALSLTMFVPALGQTPDPSAQPTQPSGVTEAEQMVPARVSLSHALDADHTQAGYQFHTTLRDNVHLDNGVTLHRGDTLLGKVTADDMNIAGRSHLALRFTQAVLKNGQTIPIKATIVGFYTPNELMDNEYAEYEQLPNHWTDQTLRVDEIGVFSGVDLHSRISSHNSGVFVSTKKDDVKIPQGSEIALAIAARNNSGPASAMNGGL